MIENTRQHKHHENCNHEHSNLKNIISKPHLSKPKKLNTNKMVRINYNSEKILDNEENLKNTDDLSFNETNCDNFLDIPDNIRKISVPVMVRKTSQFSEDSSSIRKMSIYSSGSDDKRRKSIYVKNYNYLPAFGPRKFSLYPAIFRPNELPNINKPRSTRLLSNFVANDVNRKEELVKKIKSNDDNSEFESQEEIPVNNKDISFTASLSKIGQCAMIKSYEDELYSKLKSKYPQKDLPRVNTPTFNFQTSSRKSVDSMSTPSLWSMPSYSSFTSSLTAKTDGTIQTPYLNINAPENAELRKHRVSRQILEAKKILDEIKNIKKENYDPMDNDCETETISDLPSSNKYSLDKRNSYIDIDSIGLHKMRLENNPGTLAIKRYQNWQKNWSRMLNELYFE
jgi:hypothetical protein